MGITKHLGVYNVPHCVFLSYVLIVESNIVFFKPFMDVFVKFPSLHIQLYSCCFSHVSVSFSSVGVCVKMHFYFSVFVIVFFKMFACVLHGLL